MLEIDPIKTTAALVNFLGQAFKQAGFSRAVIGLSGGLDSGVACTLTVRALGAESVYPILLPHGALNSAEVLDAMSVVEWLQIPLSRVTRIDIQPTVNELIRGLKDPGIDNVRRGNLMARVRMSILFDQAKKRQALVVGTENKSEHLLGYFTRFGDAASDLEPLAGLYKTQVRELGKHLGLPEKILTKIPSAGLWQGQTDEGELGFRYAEADQILFLLFEQKKSPEEVVTAGFSREVVDKVKAQADKNAFKHHLPIIPSSAN